MRNLKVYGLIIIVLFAAHSIFAAPTDGTNIPYKGKYITGYQNNSIFKMESLTGSHSMER